MKKIKYPLYRKLKKYKFWYLRFTNKQKQGFDGINTFYIPILNDKGKPINKLELHKHVTAWEFFKWQNPSMKTKWQFSKKSVPVIIELFPKDFIKL